MSGWKARAVAIAHARGVGRLVRPVRIEPLDCRLRLGLDAEIARRTDADEQCAAFRVDLQIAILVSLDDAEDTLLGDQLGAVGTGDRATLIRRQFIGALRRDGASRPDRADHMWHLPDTVLVRDQQVVALPCDPVGPVEILDMAIDPFHMALAVVAQECDVTGTLLDHQHVAIGQDEQSARVRETGHVRRGDKALRDLQCLAAVRNDQ